MTQVQSLTINSNLKSLPSNYLKGPRARHSFTPPPDNRMFSGPAEWFLSQLGLKTQKKSSSQKRGKTIHTMFTLE